MSSAQGRVMCAIARGLVVVALINIVGTATSHAAEALRAWKPEDSVSLRYIVADHRAPGAQARAHHDPIVISPTGRHFFFTERRGVLSCDCNEYELHVFSVESVRAALEATGSSGAASRPAPVGTIKLHSKTNRPPINSPVWTADGRAIIFVGGSGESPRQVFRFEPESKQLKQLTDAPHGVWQFALQGDTIVYRAQTGSVDWLPGLDRYPVAELIRSEQLAFPLSGGTAAKRAVFGIFASYRGAPTRQVQGVTTPDGMYFGPWLSPDGSVGIALADPQRPRPSENELIGSAGSSVVDPTPVHELEFVVIDVERARARPLLEFEASNSTVPSPGRGGEPAGRMPTVPPAVWWSSDSRYALIVNAALPGAAVPFSRGDSRYIVGYDVKNERAEILEPLVNSKTGVRVRTAGWLNQDTFLVVRESSEGRAVDGTLYTFRDGRWVGSSAPPTVQLPTSSSSGVLPEGFAISLREDANTPPVIIAADRTRELALTGPDPVLEGVWRAKAEEVSWQEPDGRAVKGLLMLPRDFSKSAPPPLVIQAYYSLPHLFRPDGFVSTGYAAQSLVAQGMAVLQIDIPAVDRSELNRTPQEGPAFVDRVDAAVEALSKQGLADPARVGLVGFSRGGYMVYYAIAHPRRVKFAAAVVADGFRGDYVDYLRMAVAIPERAATDFEEQYGMGTFWENRAAWLDQVVEFNLDRVTTPLLYSFNTKQLVLDAYALVGAFRLNRKPLEIINFPEGEHPLVRPLERLASMTATVDWMAFWLMGKEDHDPAKAAKYARWRAMRSAEPGHTVRAVRTK